jgi:O-antigen ligase
VRLRGAAAEPSYCGLYLVMGWAIASLALPRRRLGWRDAVIAAAVALTVAFTAYALALAAVAVVGWARRRSGGSLLRPLAVLLALLLLLLALPAARRAVQLGVIDRVAGVLTGTFPRTNLMRINGSYSAAWVMAQASPWLGTGLGNFDVAMPAVLPHLDRTYRMGPTDQGWSVPAYVLATLGWPGVALVLLLLGSVLARDPLAGVMAIVMACADGTLLGAPFWVLLTLLWLLPEVREPAPSPAPAAGP